MKAQWKWLFLPPALALVVLLGPLGPAARTAPVEAQSVPPPTSANSIGDRTIDTPSLWRVGSTLLGILLLGGVGLTILAKAKRRGPENPALVAQLRQSLRLGPKGRLHVVQFDGRMLLIGETDGQVALLDQGADPQSAADEDEILERDGEDGAVLRDMVIPRPAPKTASPTVQARKNLADFQALLKRVRTEKVS